MSAEKHPPITVTITCPMDHPLRPRLDAMAAEIAQLDGCQVAIEEIPAPTAAPVEGTGDAPSEEGAE